MKKRNVFRRLWLRLVQRFRRGRTFWKCPVCTCSRQWGVEHALDFYPMLLKLERQPKCCANEFPKWAYSSAFTG